VAAFFENMAKTFFFLFVTPVSAFLDAAALSLFFGPQAELFAEKWDSDYMNYQLFATVSFAATCDWSRMKHGGYIRELTDNADSSSCGTACKLLKEDFGGHMPKVNYAFSATDHVTFSTFQKERSVCTTVDGTALTNCQIPDVGVFFEDDDNPYGIVWFLSFRGTFMWDVVNHRRNFMTTLALVPMCAQCAASDGPYRNFVALRFQITRILLKVGVSIDSFQRANLGIIGTSMGGMLAQFSTAFLSAERSLISQNVFSLLTHGSPRIGNRQFARLIRSGPDVPYMSIVMYRDLVPHFPPMLHGYESASTMIRLVYVEPWFWAMKDMGDAPDIDNALFFKEFTGSQADEEFSLQFAFFDFADHVKYFMKIDEFGDLAACGGMEDKFFLNTRAIALYDSV
jgi:hypothetical protein